MAQQLYVMGSLLGTYEQWSGGIEDPSMLITYHDFKPADGITCLQPCKQLVIDYDKGFAIHNWGNGDAVKVSLQLKGFN